MSDDQSKTVVVDESLTEIEDVSMFADGTIDDFNFFAEPKADEVIDDTGKTTEQILAEAGVTLDELNRTFPPNHDPLNIHPSQLSREELMQRVKISYARARNTKANAQDKTSFPNANELNQKYIENQPENIRMTESGPSFAFEDFLGLMENSKKIEDQQQLHEKTRQTILSEVYATLNGIVEKSELETFDAESARKLYMDKIKVQSKLPDLLRLIRGYALKGQSEMHVSFLGQYDRIKLAELGFTFTNKSSGGTLAYVISWAKQ